MSGGRTPGRLRRLLQLVPSWAGIAGWGLAAGRRAGGPREVVQAVIVGEEGVVLALRTELLGWELPGGAPLPGERGEDAVRREVLEETGLEVEVTGLVGDYRRTGFAAHRARVYRCRVCGGALRASPETPAVAWFAPTALPRTLLPWFRGPLADGLAGSTEPVQVREHQGWRAILAGMAIDLAVRWRGPDAYR